jgi:hypothetical protein
MRISMRLIEFAKRNGDYGLLEQLSIFFKNPLCFKENSFFKNYIKLQDYARKNSKD